MLIITAKQLAALENGARNRFVEKTVWELRQHYPSATARFSDRALVDFVSRHVGYAEHYGLTLEAAARWFIAMALLSGTDLAPPHRTDLVTILSREVEHVQWEKIDDLYARLGPRPPLGFFRWNGTIFFGQD